MINVRTKEMRPDPIGSFASDGVLGLVKNEVEQYLKRCPEVEVLWPERVPRSLRNDPQYKGFRYREVWSTPGKDYEGLPMIDGNVSLQWDGESARIVLFHRIPIRYDIVVVLKEELYRKWDLVWVTLTEYQNLPDRSFRVKDERVLVTREEYQMIQQRLAG